MRIAHFFQCRDKFIPLVDVLFRLIKYLSIQPAGGLVRHMTSRFDAAVGLIDEANAQDPNRVETADGARPAELVYAMRMSAALARVYPQAGEELRLAVRAQHLQRWMMPRTRFSPDRKGYLAWRNAAKAEHAERAGDILSRAGYGANQIACVQALIRKQGIKRDADAQALEDVACLVFLEHYFSAFAAKHDDEKLIGILRKTWVKMSETGRQAAMKLPMDARSQALVAQALA